MATRPRAAISWSGGKDSCAALHRTHALYDVVAMVTMFDEPAERSRSHGLRPEILAAQAERLGLRQAIGRCTWPTYNAAFAGALQTLKHDGVTHVIFGDILLDDHRRWAEDMSAAQGMTAVEPLFGLPTTVLFNDWTASGSDALIVTTRAGLLDESWLGRPLRREMLAEFTRLGVDPCGERGEYHTAVTNSPLFASPLPVIAGERVDRAGCWALDLIPDLGPRASDFRPQATGIVPQASGLGEDGPPALAPPETVGATARHADAPEARRRRASVKPCAEG